jgi:membrane protein
VGRWEIKKQKHIITYLILFMKKTFNIIKDIIKDAIDSDYPGLASEMAYNFILSLFPFAMFAFALFSLLGTPNVINQIIDLLSVVAPTESLNMIRDVLTEILQTSSAGILGILALFGALWASSRAVLSVIKGMNRAYEVEETRSFWKINSLAILIVLLLVFVIFIAVNLIIFGSTILDFLNRFLPIPTDVSTRILIIRWPVTFLALFLMILINYYFLPNVRTNKKILFTSSSFGSLFFSISWLLGSWLFSLYVENFARYNAIYGTLGAFIILLIWFYYSSLIMLLGGGISSRIYKLTRPKVVEVKYNYTACKK